MSTPISSAKDGPNVEHRFDGDVRILNATCDRRHEIRRALVALAQELQHFEGQPIHVTATIQLKIGGTTPKQHVYTVNVTDTWSDDSLPSLDGPSTSSGVVRAHQETNDPNNLRPCKRPRSTLPISPDLPTPSISTNTNTNINSTTKLDELLTYIKSWHAEWTSQGGWLFDTLTKTQTSLLSEHALHLEHKMDSVQDILGQSLNSASVATLTELDNISKLLLPWLEHCRKTHAEKVQAREEKWRTSSANFHDEARRDRETAERRLEAVLAEQGVLLARIASAVGVANEGASGSGNCVATGRSSEDVREGLLGAQLRRELSLDSGPSSIGEGSGRTCNRPSSDADVGKSHHNIAVE